MSRDVLREFASRSRQPYKMVEEVEGVESVVVKGLSSLSLSSVTETSVLSAVYSSHEERNTQDRCSHFLRPPRTSCYLCTRLWFEYRPTSFDSVLALFVLKERPYVSRKLVVE